MGFESALRNVLVSAYGCEPEKGSEQGVGWNWVLEIARTQRVWVITRTNNRESIERCMSARFSNNIVFIYYDLPEALRRFKRREKGLYLYYLLWQWGAYRRALELVQKYDFDYCQHLTFGSIWMPTFMHRLSIPFVWGPIGGGEAVPLALIRTLPWNSRLVQYLRYLLIRTAPLNPFILGPAKAASAIIARTDDTKNVFPAALQGKVRVILETAMSSEDLLQYRGSATRQSSGRINLVYTGRLIAIKNVEMALRAFALARQENPLLHFTIVGGGPLEEKLVNTARELGVHEHTTFTGRIPNSAVISILQGSDIFLFPSLKEGGTWSLMEAMAVSLPVVCVAATGMNVITDEKSAIRLLPEQTQGMTKKMSDAILKLANSRQLREQMGTHARRRIVEQFSWEDKGRFMVDLFNYLDKQKLNKGRVN